MPQTIENPRVMLLDAEQLEELVSEGMAAELNPKEGYGTVALLGLEHVVRHGKRLSIVEMHAGGEIHRGILIPNQITSDSVVTVRNSGGRHKSPTLGSGYPRLMDGDRFREDFKWSHTPRRRKW